MAAQNTKYFKMLRDYPMHLYRSLLQILGLPPSPLGEGWEGGLSLKGKAGKEVYF